MQTRTATPFASVVGWFSSIFDDRFDPYTFLISQREKKTPLPLARLPTALELILSFSHCYRVVDFIYLTLAFCREFARAQSSLIAF